MKKILPLFFGLAITISSCNVEVNGDTSKENTAENEVKNGFTYGKKNITINGLEKLTNNELIADEMLIIQFLDVKNSTLKDGFQHVGISIKISDADGNVLEQADDLFSNLEQQDPKLDMFKASYGVPFSLVGQEITVEYVLFDKYGTVSYDFVDKYTVVDKPGPVTNGLDIKTNLEGLNITGQIILDKIQFASAPVEVAPSEEIYLYLNGVNGFTLIDGALNASYSLTLLNEKGEEIFYVEDEMHGEVDPTEDYPLYFSQKFASDENGNLQWIAKVKDNNSDKYIEVTTKIKVK